MASNYAQGYDYLMIRPATPEDTKTIAQLIRALADYEKLPHVVELDENRLREHLFGPRPYAEVLIAEEGGEAVGYALFFHNYATFSGKPGIYLEDLFVRPESRRHGHGRALLAALARLAIDRDCSRLEWVVLDWNTQAIDFYRSLGAVPMDDWTTYRLTGEALAAACRSKVSDA
jgi:GNAT superfamily N-acetyltransferase